jgi:hypothetical protein
VLEAALRMQAEPTAKTLLGFSEIAEEKTYPRYDPSGKDPKTYRHMVILLLVRRLQH